MSPGPLIAPFQSLRRRLDAADPSDTLEIHAIRDELLQARDSSERAGWIDIAACLEAVGQLLDSLSYRPPLDRPGIHATAVRLLRHVQARAMVSWPGGDRAKLETAPDPASPPEKGGEIALMNEMLLGEVLIQLGLLNEEQLDEALRVQAVTDRRLGEILRALQIVSTENVERGLRLQARLRGSKGGRKDDSDRLGSGAEALSDGLLGRTLLAKGTITRDDLERALMVHRAAGIRIGEALVSIGAATWDQIEEAVEEQEQADPAEELWPTDGAP